MAEGKVNCLHFLIKNTDSRNPVSRRTGQEITLTKAEAAKELAQFRDELKKAPDAKTLEKMFRAVTVKRSDCGSFRFVQAHLLFVTFVGTPSPVRMPRFK